MKGWVTLNGRWHTIQRLTRRARSAFFTRTTWAVATHDESRAIGSIFLRNLTFIFYCSYAPLLNSYSSSASFFLFFQLLAKPPIELLLLLNSKCVFDRSGRLHCVIMSADRCYCKSWVCVVSAQPYNEQSLYLAPRHFCVCLFFYSTHSTVLPFVVRACSPQTNDPAAIVVFRAVFSTIFKFLQYSCPVPNHKSPPVLLSQCASQRFWLQTPGESTPRDTVGWNQH